MTTDSKLSRIVPYAMELTRDQQREVVQANFQRIYKLMVEQGHLNQNEIENKLD